MFVGVKLLIAGLLIGGTLLASTAGGQTEPSRQWPDETAHGATAVALTMTAFPSSRVRACPCCLDATPEEMGLAALSSTYASAFIRSGVPEVAVSRRVLPSELPGLGLPDINRRDDDPPLMLVIVRGNFHAFADRLTWIEYDYHYIVYLFDLTVGISVMGGISADGNDLRALLNDPSLPDPGPYPVSTPWPTPMVSQPICPTPRPSRPFDANPAIALPTRPPTATATLTPIIGP